MTTARNPILSGFYPDPSICRVGEDFYLVNSSFAYFPGVPVFHSKDLAHWEQIGNILEREEQLPLTGCEISRGIFAPTIRYHEGTWYMITTNVDNGGNFIVTAKDPAGPWSDPHYLGDAAPGIDPSLFFDEDGRCYYVGTRPNPEGVQHNGDWEIWMQEVDLKEMKLCGESMAIWKGALKNAIWPEGPHLYKKDGWYYLMIAEGGTGPEHSISVARSRSLWQWFEGCPRNPIFTHRNLGMDYPVIYAGHGDLIDDGHGNWYVIMLASRPCQKHCSMGRETFLAKVTWENDWPVINAGVGHLEKNVEVPLEEVYFPEEYTEQDLFLFHEKTLDRRLVSIQTQNASQYSLEARKGWLRLYTGKEMMAGNGAPSYVGARQKGYCFQVSTGMEFAPETLQEEAGLVLYQNRKNHLRFTVSESENGRRLVKVTARIKEIDTVLAQKELDGTGLVELRLKGRDQQGELYIREAGKSLEKIGEAVSLIPYTTEEAGGFVGCTMGMYASANGTDSDNYADFSWFSAATLGR